MPLKNPPPSEPPRPLAGSIAAEAPEGPPPWSPPVAAPPEAPGEASPAEPVRAIEDWQRALQTPAFVFEGARYLARWGIGHQVTEAAYRNAIFAFGGAPVG